MSSLQDSMQSDEERSQKLQNISWGGGILQVGVTMEVWENERTVHQRYYKQLEQSDKTKITDNLRLKTN